MRLATDPNDHLAGPTAALELLEHPEQVHAGLAPSLKGLRHDVELDRRELESLIARLGATQSVPRQAVAWVAEKLARLEMKVDDPSGGRLKLLESLEAVAVGIHGKGSLWRADEQRERIEAARLDAARKALA